MFPSLDLVPAPPAGGVWAAGGPCQVLSGQAVARLGQPTLFFVTLFIERSLRRELYHHDRPNISSQFLSITLKKRGILVQKQTKKQ